MRNSLVTLALCGVLLGGAGCRHAPPNLTPEAISDFNKTQIIGALDVIRDTAIRGAATTPPVISPQTARIIVQYHRSALRIMDALSTGWQHVISTSLDETLTHLSTTEQAVLAPDVQLIKAVLAEVQ